MVEAEDAVDAAKDVQYGDSVFRVQCCVVSVCVRVHVCACVCLCVHLRVCLCVCESVCVYV